MKRYEVKFQRTVTHDICIIVDEAEDDDDAVKQARKMLADKDAEGTSIWKKAYSRTDPIDWKEKRKK